MIKASKDIELDLVIIKSYFGNFANKDLIIVCKVEIDSANGYGIEKLLLKDDGQWRAFYHSPFTYRGDDVNPLVSIVDAADAYDSDALDSQKRFHLTLNFKQINRERILGPFRVKCGNGDGDGDYQLQNEIEINRLLSSFRCRGTLQLVDHGESSSLKFKLKEVYVT